MTSDWVNLLIQTLVRLKKNNSPLRAAIIGVGHELRGDDAAGVIAARTLKAALVPQTNILILDGGQAPENQTGVLRRFMPGLVLLIDAAQMGLPGGAICWLTWQETNGLSASTHTLPLYIMAQYLTNTLGCEVALIGIQPAHTALGAGMSAVVSQSVEEIAGSIQQVWDSIFFCGKPMSETTLPNRYQTPDI